MRIGLFGGTFNPIHNGHIRVAREIRAKSELETIYFIPAHLPPHKGLANLATASDRWEMIQLALSDEKGLKGSTVEMNRPGPSFTIDTIRHFKTRSQPAEQLFLILGVDAFLEIDTWKSFHDLIRELPFIIMMRPGSLDETDAKAPHRKLADYIRHRISPAYNYDAATRKFVHPVNQNLSIPDLSPVDISSTMIRKRLKQGLSIDTLVPDTVRDYIHRKGLYR